MNQNKAFDFSVPNRQSPVAILLVILKTSKTVFRQLIFPIIVFFFLGRKSNNYGEYFIYFILFFSVVSMIYSIINFFKSYFYIQGKELIVHSGFISKKQLSIPFERIQNINFEQNIIHQIFGVKKVKIDTAGSTDKEFEFAAIENSRAEALRDILINESKRSVIYSTKDSRPNEIRKEKVILQLSYLDLIKAGLFENHLKSASLIFLAAWYLYANAQEVGLDPDDYIDRLPPIAYGLYLLFGLIVIFSVVSILISLVKTTLNHYNLKFLRILDGFKLEQGLFNTVTVSALDHKIQTMTWSDTLIQKLVGIFEIKLKQAVASSGKKTKASIIIPGASKQHVDQVLAYIFPKGKIESIKMKKVHISYRNRKLFFYCVLPAIAIVLSIFAGEWRAMVIALLFLLFLPIYVIFNFQKLGYGYNSELIRLKGGAFGEKNIVTFIHKLQSIKSTQSPFQRKRGLVSLHLENASGSLAIPYIDEKEAINIMDLFLKKVESDKRYWM